MFRITYMTPARVDFECGDRSGTVDGEALVKTPGSPSFVIYSNTFRNWKPPHQDDPVTEATRRAVMNDLLEGFRERGMTAEVE